MSTVGRVTEITSISETSFDDAIRVGMERATETLRNVKSGWVKEQEILMDENGIRGYKVNLLVTFILE